MTTASKTPSRARRTAKPTTKSAAKPAAKASSSRRSPRSAKQKPKGGNYGLIGGVAVGLAAGAALLAYLVGVARPGDAEHEAPDLALDQPHPGPDHRAPEAFRPDPTAPVPANEREGLRPATGPAPTLVRGEMAGTA